MVTVAVAVAPPASTTLICTVALPETGTVATVAVILPAAARLAGATDKTFGVSLVTLYGAVPPRTLKIVVSPAFGSVNVAAFGAIDNGALAATVMVTGSTAVAPSASTTVTLTVMLAPLAGKLTTVAVIPLVPERAAVNTVWLLVVTV